MVLESTSAQRWTSYRKPMKGKSNEKNCKLMVDHLEHHDRVEEFLEPPDKGRSEKEEELSHATESRVQQSRADEPIGKNLIKTETRTKENKLFGKLSNENWDRVTADVCLGLARVTCVFD